MLIIRIYELKALSLVKAEMTDLSFILVIGTIIASIVGLRSLSLIILNYYILREYYKDKSDQSIERIECLLKWKYYLLSNRNDTDKRIIEYVKNYREESLTIGNYKDISETKRTGKDPITDVDYNKIHEKMEEFRKKISEIIKSSTDSFLNPIMEQLSKNLMETFSGLHKRMVNEITENLPEGSKQKNNQSLDKSNDYKKAKE